MEAVTRDDAPLRPPWGRVSCCLGRAPSLADNTVSLKRSYQQTDAEPILGVVLELHARPRHVHGRRRRGRWHDRGTKHL